MKSDRALARWLSGESSANESGALRERVRHDESVRRVYDDYFAILDALGHGEGAYAAESARSADEQDSKRAPRVSHDELRWLENEFFQTWHEPSEGWLPRWIARVSWLHALPPLGVVAAALIAVWIGVANDESSGHPRASGRPSILADKETRLVARGAGRDAQLELEVFCGEPPVPVNDARCVLSDRLTFAARATREGQARALSVFGADADGDAKFYAPTPKDARAIQVTGEGFQTADFSTQLAIHHQEGPLQIFAVLAPRAARVEEIEAWAAVISEHSAFFDGPDSWITRMAQLDPALVEDLCPDSDACDAVQTQLWLDSSGEHP